ncbi:hypothetical protein M1247_03445 [Mycobacterium sp. 21AC1]|uniref:hypothetical protein n=1 Tax=[Mycobacterium] appelbergii TaxID=2939269 RepID=UPI002938EA6D|nr:hypothetical protein [Mycobacterium sp. 21AC1]MDV3123961.1 hypothetical protein [Mycobacterium sp. 21AC1]
MGRTAAVIWHALSAILAAGLYFFFVLPRWPELMGQTSTTLGLVLRIVTGVLVGLTALPVVFTLLRTKRPEFGTPQLALRLRTSSIALHVVAGVLIVGAAIAEIWISLDSAGQWLFGIYGAAAAIALLGFFGFYLAFIAELPPPPPKPLKVREAKRRGRGKKAEADEPAEAADAETGADDAETTETTDEESPAEVIAAEPEAAAEDSAEVSAETSDEDSNEDSPADEADENADEKDDNAGGKLRNRRPSNKGGTSRLRRRSRGGVAVED